MTSLTVAPDRTVPAAVRSRELPRHPLGRIFSSGPLIIAAASIVLSLGTAVECGSIAHLPSLIYGLILWGWWGIAASILWRAGKGGSSLLKLSRRSMAFHALIACAAGLVHLMLLGSLGIFITEWRVQAPIIKILVRPISPNRFGMEILIYGFILGLIGSIHSQIRAQRDALRAAELRRQLAAAQLKALQMQLEPHFLFNTLNAITTLVELGRQHQAAEMLGHLNAILQRTLERETPEKIPLSQELEMVENYLAIEQVRFADRLHVNIKVDPGALHSLVPCFLLQPIVENAIRHGIANCEGDGTVEATARREGNRLRICVRDTGPGRTAPTPGNGIGLRNTRERLSYFYPQEHRLQAGAAKAGGFEVAIDIPYEVAG